jgi:hypothetical protein
MDFTLCLRFARLINFHLTVLQTFNFHVTVLQTFEHGSKAIAFSLEEQALYKNNNLHTLQWGRLSTIFCSTLL